MSEPARPCKHERILNQGPAGRFCGECGERIEVVVAEPARPDQRCMWCDGQGVVTGQGHIAECSKCGGSGRLSEPARPENHEAGIEAAEQAHQFSSGWRMADAIDAYLKATGLAESRDRWKVGYEVKEAALAAAEARCDKLQAERDSAIALVRECANRPGTSKPVGWGTAREQMRRCPSAIRRELDEQRAGECRALPRDPAEDDLFFCGLGTLWCTEGHGPLAWQSPDDWASREAGRV